MNDRLELMKVKLAYTLLKEQHRRMSERERRVRNLLVNVYRFGAVFLPRDLAKQIEQELTEHADDET